MRATSHEGSVSDCLETFGLERGNHMDTAQRYGRARQRVQAIKGFYLHLTVYMLVNAGLFLINLLTAPAIFWFYWPLLGWGIGLAAHAVAIFGVGRWLGADWEEREINKILEQED
jgi:hypothetical protein